MKPTEPGVTMFGTMSKKKGSPAASESGQVTISVRVHRPIAEALTAFRGTLEFDPGPSPIINRALAEFLAGKGYLVQAEPDAGGGQPKTTKSPSR